VIMDDTGVGVCATQKKWDKVKCLINKLKAKLDETVELDRKELDSIQGVLVCLQ
jgi:hypothetical protein